MPRFACRDAEPAAAKRRERNRVATNYCQATGGWCFLRAGSECHLNISGNDACDKRGPATDQNHLRGDAIPAEDSLFLRHPELDLIRVQDVGLEGMEDSDILAWAAVHNRIVLTHDRTTMPDFAYARVVTEQPMPGVFVVDDHMGIRQAIDEILLIEHCSEHVEWNGLVVYLPL